MRREKDGALAGASAEGTPATAAAGRYPHAARGYAESAAASVLNGSVGVMVSYAAMPTALLVVMRMFFAAVFLSPLTLRRARLAELRERGVPCRLLVMGLLLAADMVLYFVSIRYAGVAAAIFLVYTAPIYVAAAAPRVLHEPADRVTYVALAIALAGMAAIVGPGLFDGAGGLNALGLLAGAGAGLCYAVNLLMLKRMQTKVPATSMVWVECLVAMLALLPLGIYQWTAQDYRLGAVDVLMAALLGLLTVAIGFTLYIHGMKYIKVQHGAIIGYLEPVSAPLYALVLLGQVPDAYTVVGGALIVVAGVLLVVKGRSAAVEAREVPA